MKENKDKLRICVITGSRSDYGLLYYFLKELQSDKYFELNVVATGMHLSPEYGSTINVIVNDGFPVYATVETLLSSDSAIGVAKATGLGIIGFADVFQRLDPDLVIVLGDRFEIFAAAQAALFMRIPIAHIGGGDITAGAFDEAIRHSISKMSHLHFVTNDQAKLRLIKLGESPQHIFNVGSPGLDHLNRTILPDRAALEREIDFKFRDHNLLITFHPATLDTTPSENQLNELFKAISHFSPKFGVIFTLPNADTGGRKIIDAIHNYSKQQNNVRVYTSMGQRLYLAVMSEVNVVVGNSSSGLYEAPSVGTPTVNIGRRQEGRLRAASVFDCNTEANSIINAVNQAITFGKQIVDNPYKQGDCALMIKNILKEFNNFEDLLLKTFND